MVVLVNAGPLIQIAAFTMAGIAAIDLTDDGVVFHVAAVRHMHSELLNQLIDMTPAIMETSSLGDGRLNGIAASSDSTKL